MTVKFNIYKMTLQIENNLQAKFPYFTRIPKDEQLFAKKLDNLEEMDSLQKLSAPKLNQGETDNLNSTIIRSEIESVIKK